MPTQIAVIPKVSRGLGGTAARLFQVNVTLLTGNRVFKMLKATFDAWMEDNALRLSAALAYYSIFSMAPLLVIAISVAGLVLGEPAVRGQLDDQLKGYVGPQAAQSLQEMIKSASKPSDGWTGGIVGFFTLILGASGVFGQLKDALNTIWEVKVAERKGIWGFIRTRLLSFGMVLVIGFLLLTSLLLTTALAAVNGYLEVTFGIPKVFMGALGFVVSLGVVTTLFAFIFKVLPDAEIKWRNVWIGAAVTALLFELGKLGLGFYLGRESTASSYGAAGSVVLLLLWVYYSSCILLFGAEFTQVYARETGHDIKPAAGAIPVTAEKRAQEGLVPLDAVEEVKTPEQPEPTPEQPKPQPRAVAVEPESSMKGMLTTVAGSFLAGAMIGLKLEKANTPPRQRRRSK